MRVERTVTEKAEGTAPQLREWADMRKAQGWDVFAFDLDEGWCKARIGLVSTDCDANARERRAERGEG